MCYDFVKTFAYYISKWGNIGTNVSWIIFSFNNFSKSLLIYCFPLSLIKFLWTIKSLIHNLRALIVFKLFYFFCKHEMRISASHICYCYKKSLCILFFIIFNFKRTINIQTYPFKNFWCLDYRQDLNFDPERFLLSVH